MPPRPASRPGPPPRPAALAAPGCPCCSRRARAAPATPACSPGASPSLRRHPLAGGGMSPHAAPSRLAPSPSREPSGIGAVFPEGPVFFRGTFHARSHFPGRSCLFHGDLPCQGPFSRKVLRFSGGPSMPGAVFPEGPALFRGTFHARGCFSGRSCLFPGDLPCQGPFFRKVRERVGERVGEKDCTVAGIPF